MRSKFRTVPVRADVNGEHRLQMRLPSGAYSTIAHFTDGTMARNITRLLNKRSTPPSKHDAARDSLQRELLPVDHRSVTQRRLKYNGINHDWINPEAFYHAAWRRANNHLRTRPLLPGILVPDVDRKKGWEAVPVSRRDAMVAATVIQWLGTSVGRGFVLGVEREIAEARKKQEQVSAVRKRLRPPAPPQPGRGGKAKKDILDAARKRLADATKGAK